MVKMAMSAKKIPKLVLKGSPAADGWPKNQMCFASNSQTVTSQVTLISQLTEMVSAVQQENKTIMLHFDKLTEQIAEHLSAQKTTPNQCPAGCHRSESGQPT